MRSSKQRADINRGITDRVLTLHQRLRHALNLGLRSYSDKGRKWHCTDIETQRLVVRSISAFLDSISGETLQHPSVKESVADMIKALEGILHLENKAILGTAANVTVKLLSILPNSILQIHISDLVHPLSSLLCFDQSEVTVPCASALRLILSKLSIKRENEVWKILEEIRAVITVVRNIQDFTSGTEPIENFIEMVSLLSTILWRWPPSRYNVWTDAELMKVLQGVFVECDISAKISILQLYASIALCGYGARKLLENEALVQMMVYCMDDSHPDLVRTEGFKLAQCLVMNEQGCLSMMSMCCEPVIKAIICGMSGWTTHSGKVSNDRMCLLVEACRLALVTRWAGEHHIYFWKLGVERVLLDLLLSNFHKERTSEDLSSLEKQVAVAEEGLKANFLQVLRPYMWDILGWLAAHCGEEFENYKDGEELCFKMLITCACVAFVDSIHKSQLVCQDDASIAVRGESACRAVMMMIYSPCKCIAAQTRSILSQILKLNGNDYLKYLINRIDSALSSNTFGTPDTLQTAISLMGLTCYSALPQYQKHVIKFGGIKTLFAFLRSCLTSQDRVGRSRIAPHLHHKFSERACCWDSTNDWDASDIFLLFSLWGLAEMIHCVSSRNHPDLFSGYMGYSEAQLINELLEICIDSFTPGVKWNAAYILAHFGVYGFPSRLGKRIGKALNEEENADMRLILMNEESFSVHGVILMARCPSLLPPGELPPSEKTSHGCEKLKEVRVSANVSYQPLLKLLEYVYLGYLLAEDDLVKKLKSMARLCDLLPLLQLICRKRPKWGTPFSRFDLRVALGPAGRNFSDIVMEAKATEVMNWTCSFCSLSVPHIHVHKVILWSSCDYLRALFQSGMQESQSRTIKVPISWEALSKLVHWFYSDELPKPVSGCLWDNMDSDEKLHELLPYVELCWLAEFWFLDDVHKDSSRVIESRLDSAKHLSVKIIQTAAEFSQWKLAEMAANYMAPLYRHLRNSGELEGLDQEIVDMVRAASVRLLSHGSHS